MTSLLERIDEKLASCTDPAQRAEYFAEKGCYLARVGDFAAAQNILAMLQQEFGDGRNPRVSVWKMLLEGLLLFFERLNASSHDRILRAHRLAAMLGLHRLMPLTAAWLAHIEFDRSNYTAVGTLLRIGMSSPGSQEADVKIRIGLVLADAYLHAGDRLAAQHWYESARRHAVASGDRAAIGALIYNRAAFGLSLRRVELIIHDNGQAVEDDSLLHLVAIEVESARAFLIGTRDRSLGYLIDLCRARVLMLRGQLTEAVECFEELLDSSEIVRNRSNDISILADFAFCLECIGRRAQAIEVMRGVLEWKSMTLDSDDEVILLFVAARVLGDMGRSIEATSFLQALTKAKSRYTHEIEELKLVLRNVFDSQSS